MAGLRPRSATGRSIEFGVVVSGKCFCPSRSPERIGNHCGRGTPLPLLCRLSPCWPARHGLGPDDARCGESAHRLNPLLRSQPRGFVGLRQVDQTAGRLQDESRLWRGHQEQLAGATGCGRTPSLGSVTCACTPQSLAGRSFGRAVTTGAPRSDGAHRWRSGWALKGWRSRPIGSAAGAGVDTFSCLAAAGSRETCRLRCPNFGRAMRDGHQAG